MKISSSIKSIVHFYHKMSPAGKILLFVTLLLIMIVFFRSLPYPSSSSLGKEGFVNQPSFLFKRGVDVYDDFYAEIYDYLVFNMVKNDYEVGQILSATTPNSYSRVLDVGCGTGHHVAKIADQKIDIIGIDISPSMIQKAKENYPLLTFQIGNVIQEDTFRMNSFTHILCLYFTLYYFKDKDQFFRNCMEWLLPGGYLIVHVVNREKFDPILPPGNPLYVVSPQKYAKERITKTKIHFNEFEYTSQFDLMKETDLATFQEKFKFPDGKTRTNEHVLYMEDEDDILTRATDAGFLIHGKINLMNCAYDHQYLYLLLKP
jgi:SAM-dependent methyltransferase